MESRPQARTEHNDSRCRIGLAWLRGGSGLALVVCLAGFDPLTSFNQMVSSDLETIHLLCKCACIIKGVVTFKETTFDFSFPNFISGFYRIVNEAAWLSAKAADRIRTLCQKFTIITSKARVLPSA